MKLKYISTKEDNFKRMVLYFRILEPNSLNIVNKDMNDKGITETNLPFWCNVSDNEFVLKAISQNCKCCVGFEQNVEYDIDVEFKSYRAKKRIYMYIA